MKRIALYCNWGVYVDKSGTCWLPSVHAQYIKGLKNIGYKRIYLFSKKANSLKDGMDYPLSKGEINLVSLPWFDSYIGAVKNVFSIAQAFFRLWRVKVDVLYIRVYEPFSWLLVLISFFNSDCKRVMHYISDPTTAIWMNRKDSVLQKLFRQTLFYPEYLLTNIFAIFCRVTANGPVPKKNVPFFVSKKMHEIIESSLLEENIVNESSLLKSSSDNLNILYVGYLRPSKGVDDIIDAIYLFSQSVKEFTLTLVGDGEYRSCLERKVKQYGLSEKIKFSGYVPFSDDLFEFYKNSDVFINLSRSETGPRVLLEALNFGCYIISTDVGYASSVIDEFSGVILDSSDPKHVCAHLIEFIEKKKGVEVSVNVRKNYTVESFFKGALDEA